MRWKSARRSSNVEDRRGSGPALRSGAMGGGLITLLLRFLPRLIATKAGRYILGIGLVVFIGARALNIDLLSLVSGTGTTQVQDINPKFSAEEDELAEFVKVVLGDTETTWKALFNQQNQQYVEPTLVLFSGSVNSACGFAQAAMGPFYCPADQKVYIDLSFYRDLKNRHGAPGDFAQAYVIAHEVGHHVQTLLGISGKVRQAQAKLSKAEANQLSVRLELQADCFAGLWGYAAKNQRNMLEEGDFDEAIVAAAAIGDDRLQKRGQGYVVPESFTHGSSAQRVKWFKRGFNSGNMKSCDTFSEQAI